VSRKPARGWRARRRPPLRLPSPPTGRRTDHRGKRVRWRDSEHEIALPRGRVANARPHDWRRSPLQRNLRALCALPLHYAPPISVSPNVSRLHVRGGRAEHFHTLPPIARTVAAERSTAGGGHRHYRLVRQSHASIGQRRESWRKGAGTTRARFSWRGFVLWGWRRGGSPPAARPISFPITTRREARWRRLAGLRRLRAAITLLHSIGAASPTPSPKVVPAPVAKSGAGACASHHQAFPAAGTGDATSLPPRLRVLRGGGVELRAFIVGGTRARCTVGGGTDCRRRYAPPSPSPRLPRDQKGGAASTAAAVFSRPPLFRPPLTGLWD